MSYERYAQPTADAKVTITRDFVYKKFNHPNSPEDSKELAFAREAKAISCPAAVKIVSVTRDTIKMEAVIPLGTLYMMLPITLDPKSFLSRISKIQDQFNGCFSVYHCDAHGNNVAFDKKGNLVFIDFGRVCSIKRDLISGSDDYMYIFRNRRGRKRLTFEQLSGFVRDHFTYLRELSLQ